MSQSEQRNIVIVGGGIVGCTTAYYLSRHPSYSAETTTVTVIEASVHGAAQGASGKAGGLVAKWAYPRELVDISFPEHVKLAEQHNGRERWGWRFVGCGSWEGRGEALGDTGSGVGQGGKKKSLEKTLGHQLSREDTGLPDDLTWVNKAFTESYSAMSGPGGTAQVHPYLFTTSMLELAKEKGVHFVTGSATSIDRANGRVTGVSYREPGNDSEHKILPATHVILSAGAWSPSLVPSLPISATRAHSVTIRPKPDVTITPYVLFTEIQLPPIDSAQRGPRVSPEIYARPDNEVYACGSGDDSKLPGNVDEVQVDQEACESIREHVSSISQELREGVVEKRQACFLPVVSTGGGPIVGDAKKFARGLYIATGHTCWGICNAPGTAKLIAQLVMDEKTGPGNLRKLAPSKFL